MKKTQLKIKKVLNTALGVVALLGLIACPTEPTDRGSEGIPATNLVINEGDVSNFTTNGGSDTLRAAVLPTNHTEGEVVWSSDNTSVVTVTKVDANNATYNAIADGSATITARVGNASDTIAIVVRFVPATNIEILGDDALSIMFGETNTLSALVTPTNHTDGDIVWSSSSSEIVTINSVSGEYRGIEGGSATITAKVGTNNVMDTITIMVNDNRVVIDNNRNGLIDILDLTMLHNMRYNLAGTSYKASNSDTGNTRGCTVGVCQGYELVSNLSFDTDGDGTWSGSAGSYTLDSNDNNAVYFNVSQGGWEPIGDESNRFTAIFDGGGNTITGLAISRNQSYLGLFGYSSGARIRQVGLVSNLVHYSGGSSNKHVGGLVGRLDNGAITAGYTTGVTDGGDGIIGLVGGLVGFLCGNNGSTITASYTTGVATVGEGPGGNRVGGLVGFMLRGSIIASYATGAIAGGDGIRDYVGGLVGEQRDNCTITASYATGDVDGGSNGDFGDYVGGLVGHLYVGGTITASYATGTANGGSGADDLVGSLVGLLGGTVSASYGFGGCWGQNLQMPLVSPPMG